MTKAEAAERLRVQNARLQEISEMLRRQPVLIAATVEKASRDARGDR